jgi:hypothetical protein
MSPQERVAKAVEYGSRIHPQYTAEFENGISVAWHRSPFTLGCFGMWTEEARAKHYDNLCAIDGRIVLAGEHASYMPAWQEGALTSALDAIGRLHRRASREERPRDRRCATRANCARGIALMAAMLALAAGGARPDTTRRRRHVRRGHLESTSGEGDLSADLPGMSHARRARRERRGPLSRARRRSGACCPRSSWRSP